MRNNEFELKFKNRKIYKYGIPKRNMKRSALLLTLLLGIVFLFPLISSANTVTLNLPSANILISGATYGLEASLDSNTLNLTNAWFILQYSNNTNTTIFAYEFNDSDTAFNVTWDTTGFVDVDGLTMWVIVANETPTSASNTTDSSLVVDIDNGLPTATSSSASANYGYRAKLTETLTYGVNADNDIGISSCRVIFVDKENNAIVDTGTTITGYACANTSIVLADIGLSKGSIYDVIVQATDGNGNRTNTTRTLSILTSTGVAPSGTGIGAGGIGQGFVNSAKSIGKVFTTNFWSDFWDFLKFWN